MRARSSALSSIRRFHSMRIAERSRAVLADQAGNAAAAASIAQQ